MITLPREVVEFRDHIMDAVNADPLMGVAVASVWAELACAACQGDEAAIEAMIRNTVKAAMRRRRS